MFKGTWQSCLLLHLQQTPAEEQKQTYFSAAPHPSLGWGESPMHEWDQAKTAAFGFLDCGRPLGRFACRALVAIGPGEGAPAPKTNFQSGVGSPMALYQQVAQRHARFRVKRFNIKCFRVKRFNIKWVFYRAYSGPPSAHTPDFFGRSKSCICFCAM